MQRPTDNNEHDMDDRPQGQCGSGAEGREMRRGGAGEADPTRGQTTHSFAGQKEPGFTQAVGGGKMGKRHP